VDDNKVEDNRMQVTIVSEWDSRPLPAKVDPNCPAHVVLAGLQDPKKSGPFLAPARPGQPYTLTLHRTKTQIAPSATMAAAGVRDGDVLHVSRDIQGAVPPPPPWTGTGGR